MNIDYMGKNSLAHLIEKIYGVFAQIGHSHSKSDIRDFPEIPTKTSDLVNDSGFKTTDNNTTYTLTKDGETIVLTGSDGSAMSVEDSDTKITVDSVLSVSSTNPVQNKVVNTALNEKVPITRTINGKVLTDNITLTPSDVGADASGAATSAVSTHNTATDTHNDIRDLISGLTTRLNALADSDDTTLDQLSEIVAYIKSNKSLIEDITTNKVNVSDIINNLTTNVSNKPLSAAQGVVIKNLIDALQSEVSGKAPKDHNHAISNITDLQSSLDSKAPSSHASTAATYGLGNVSSYGHVKLSDETGSTDGVGAGVAATPYAVKLTHDLASSAKTIADSKVSKSGDTMTGALIINASNPYVHFKDTAYSTDWYIQAYQDQYGFGTTWSTAVKSDKNGNMTVVGTATIGNKVKLQYDSTNECLNFSFV